MIKRQDHADVRKANVPDNISNSHDDITKTLRENVVCRVEVLAKDAHDSPQRHSVKEAHGSKEDAVDGLLVEIATGVEREERHGNSENKSHAGLNDTEKGVDAHVERSRFVPKVRLPPDNPVAGQNLSGC